MEEIRLTCGGCNKKYRLPGKADGYFRCRRCDLVMAIPSSKNKPDSTSAASRAHGAAGAGRQAPAHDEHEYEVIEDDDIDEIVMDPSTNEPVHLTPGSSASASFSSERIEAYPNSAAILSAPHYRGHVKKSTAFNPTDAAAIFVGVCMVLGGWFTIVLQLLKEGGGQSRSMIAMLLGLFVAILGVGLIAIGLRLHKKILLPACIAGTLATICLFGVGMIPTSPPPESAAKTDEENQNGDGLFDPGESAFNVESQKKKSAERKAELDNIDRRIAQSRERKKRDDDLAASRDKSKSGAKSSTRSTTPKRDVASSNSKSTESAPAASSKGSGRYARKIETLWNSVEPNERRGDLLEDMRDVVEDGLDDANPDERDYWEMLEKRLLALRKFEDGNWIPLDFKYGLTGWHHSSQASLEPDSDESMKVTAKSGTRGALLSSSDMFYGPLTVKAKLKLAGDFAGKDAPQIGLTFLSGKTNDSIKAGDCVVLFDPAFQNIWSGSSTTNKTPTALDTLSPKISTLSPIELQINVCDGYVQVFGNKQLLVEKFDRSINDPHSIGLAVLGSQDSDCDFEISDWKVRSWKSGRPPGGDAFAEEDLMYLTEAIDEFDDLGWYHYRLALARFGTGKFEKATESARRAVAAGIPEENLSLVFALENELKDEHVKAEMNYISVPPGVGQEIAKAWHAWFVLTHPNAGIRSKPTTTEIADDVFAQKWVVNRIKAALAAKRGNFGTAVNLLSEVNKDVPMLFRGDTSKQLQAYQAETEYYRERSRMPFYHTLKLRLTPDKVQFDNE